MLHGILPKAWKEAFGTYEIAPLRQNPPNPLSSRNYDWHVYVKSKVRRVQAWLSLEESPSVAAVFAYCSGPGDYCLQLLQRLDSQGGILREMANHKCNPFWQVVLQYTLIAIEPGKHLKSLVWYYVACGP